MRSRRAGLADPGLARERTTLAWQRSGLALVVIGAFEVLAAVRADAGAAAVALAATVTVGVALLLLHIVRGGRSQRGLAGAVAALALAGAVVVVVGRL